MKSLITKISRLLTVSLMVGVLVGGVAVLAIPAQSAHAQEPNPNLCRGVLATGEDGSGQDCSALTAEEGQKGLTKVIKNILNIFSFVVGAISVIMIIIGGFRYITSGGDQKGVGDAKNTILYAIVGLVIVLFAQVIVKYVIGSLTKQT